MRLDVLDGRGLIEVAVDDRNSEEARLIRFFRHAAVAIAQHNELVDVVARLLNEEAAGEFTIGLIEDARAAIAKEKESPR